MQDLSRFVPNVHFEQIPIKNLVSNQEYQRPLSQAQVEKAIEDFDLNQINPVKVSRRDGINYVFNGQHTIEIVATVSGSRETPVWCMIYDSLDYQNEADIFANQMKHVRPLKPYEIFMANIEAGNEQQLVIKRLVESYSLSIGPTKAYGVICAVATLERIYTKYGYHVLDRTLRLCVGTWEGDIDSLGGNILAGVAKMVVAFGDQLRDETFKEKVGFMSVRQLSRIAKERGAGSLGYAEAMLIAYNRKCRYTLRMTKLHSGTITTEDDFVEVACVHGLEATSVAKGMSVFCGKIGTKVASDIVNAVDDGTNLNAWGSINVDDEGTPSKCNVLIENGILKTYLVDKRNSRKMNHPITGSSRRESYKYQTTSRMTNTYFLNGKSTFEEIIQNTKYGLFAKEMGGGSVNPATGEFNFAVNVAYMIEDGKITKPVKGATLVGSGKDVLLRIDMIGNNLSCGYGMCGSESGSIPTIVGQPTIRVSHMTVGGKGGNN